MSEQPTDAEKATKAMELSSPSSFALSDSHQLAPSDASAMSQFSSPTTIDHLPVLSEDLQPYMDSKHIELSETDNVRQKYMALEKKTSMIEEDEEEKYYATLDRFGFIRSSEELEKITNNMETEEM